MVVKDEFTESATGDSDCLVLQDLKELESDLVVVDVDLLVPPRSSFTDMVILLKDLYHQLIKFYFFVFNGRMTITVVTLDKVAKLHGAR